MHIAWKVSLFGVILVRIFPHSQWIRENADQNNSEYKHFLRSGQLVFQTLKFFFYQGFLSQTPANHRTTGEGGDHLLFHSAISTHSRTFRHLFATLHVRWLSHIFSRTAFIYQTPTRWDLPPHWITIWLIDDSMLIFLFAYWWFDSRFLLQQFDTGNLWIWTRVDHHSCITSELTNQVH